MKKILLSLYLLFGIMGHAFAQQQSLIVYATMNEPVYIDAMPVGVSVGDIYMRSGNLKLTEDGAVVGEYYSQATIISLDAANAKSARSYFSEKVFEGGTFYEMDFVQLNHGKPVEAGHKHEGAVIGGTGKYAGIRGSYTLEILPSSQMAKITYTYWLGQ